MAGLRIRYGTKLFVSSSRVPPFAVMWILQGDVRIRVRKIQVTVNQTSGSDRSEILVNISRITRIVGAHIEVDPVKINRFDENISGVSCYENSFSGHAMDWDGPRLTKFVNPDSNDFLWNAARKEDSIILSNHEPALFGNERERLGIIIDYSGSREMTLYPRFEIEI